MSSQIENAPFCEGCPKSEAFGRINEASKNKNRAIRHAGRLGKSLLNLTKLKGPSSIVSAETPGAPFCCKQALVELAQDTIKRTEHAVMKNKLDN